MPGGTNMWKRNEAVNPPSGQSGTPGASTQPAGTPPPPAARTRSERDVAHIGPSVVIKGEVHGGEDLTIDGVVEGQIELREHVLTIGPHGRIKAQVVVKSVVVLGEVTGDVTASERVDIREGGGGGRRSGGAARGHRRRRAFLRPRRHAEDGGARGVVSACSGQPTMDPVKSRRGVERGRWRSRALVQRTAVPSGHLLERR